MFSVPTRIGACDAILGYHGYRWHTIETDLSHCLRSTHSGLCHNFSTVTCIHHRFPQLEPKEFPYLLGAIHKLPKAANSSAMQGG